MQYIATSSSNQELYHHGIKGQKWGVRNGPPYPIEDKVLRKGTVLRSVTGETKNAKKRLKTDHWIYTYDPKRSWDSRVYEGPFSYYLKRYRDAKFIVSHEFKTVKDLNMPTKKERVDLFKEIYNDEKYKSDMIDDLIDLQGYLRHYDIGSTKSQRVDLEKLKSDDDYEAAYEVFCHAMETSYSYDSTREYSKRISDKYDAMVDDNNVNRYNDVKDPIIIFRADALISTHGRRPVKKISNSDIRTNTSIVRKALELEGKDLLY